MPAIGERNFHLVMGAAFFAAVLAETALAEVLPAWNPPKLGFLAFVVGLVWVGRYAAWRSELHDERDRVVQERVERVERGLRAVEDDLREHFGRPR